MDVQAGSGMGGTLGFSQHCVSLSQRTKGGSLQPIFLPSWLPPSWPKLSGLGEPHRLLTTSSHLREG